MAKKNKKKPVEETPVANAPEITTETTETVVTPEIEPVTEPEAGEQPTAETENTVEPEAEITPEEPAVEPEPEVVVEKTKRARSISLKESFEKALEQTPFVLFQNGVQLVRWKPNVRIECFEDGFEMNGHKYSYSGIEFRHL